MVKQLRMNNETYHDEMYMYDLVYVAEFGYFYVLFFALTTFHWKG